MRRAGRKPVPLEDRFWSKATLNTENGCFEWIVGEKTYGKHGRIWLNGKSVSAHRKAYELIYGPIKEGMYICHLCDNKMCVNPEHLYEGTNSDNITDFFERNPNYKPFNPNTVKTSCPRGHNYDRTNGRGDRVCGICASRRLIEYKERKRLNYVS